jgi:ADP-ribose pyrophosphatase YjhB (NUDIX family)
VDLEQQIRLLGDHLRAIAQAGLYYSEGKPYDADRYERILDVTAELFALADTRPGPEIRRTLFHQLTHIAPLVTADAAVFDDADRLLLIRRADDGHWALPGGMIDPGETPAEAAVREAREECGAIVEPLALVGVYDSRFCGTTTNLQLYHFVVGCRLVEATGVPETPWEVTAQQWVARLDGLDMSPGHEIKAHGAFAWHRGRTEAYLDLG